MIKQEEAQELADQVFEAFTESKGDINESYKKFINFLKKAQEWGKADKFKGLTVTVDADFFFGSVVSSVLNHTAASRLEEQIYGKTGGQQLS